MTDSEQLKAKEQQQEQRGVEEQQQPATIVNDSDTEANDLRELNLSATFLTPYAVAPAQDHRVWLSNTKQTYVDFSGPEGRDSLKDLAPNKVEKRKGDMRAMIGFQGWIAGQVASTETGESHAFTGDFQSYVNSRDKAFFRTRDHFSDYAEAKARDPSRSKK